MIDWKNNLEILMPKLTEGTLSKDEEKQLEKILGSNPEARKYYLSYIDVDTALEEQIGIPNFNIPNIPIQKPANPVVCNKPITFLSGYLKLGMSVAAVLALLLYIFNSDTTPVKVSTIKSISGAVKIFHKNSKELLSLEVGMTIPVGSTVEAVSADSFVELEFHDQSILTLSGPSRCIISKYSNNDRELRLLNGKLWADIKTRSNLPTLNLYTPSSRFNVLKATFDIEETEEFSEFKVEKGKVQLTRLTNNQSKEVKENQEVFTSIKDKLYPFLLRHRTTDNWYGKQKWEIKISSEKIPLGWEPYAYDSNDKQYPFLLRRRTTDNWDGKQKWELKTSSRKIPEGWEPFGYDSNDEQAPFLLRRRTTDNWDGKQQWKIKTSSGKIPEGWEPYAYDTNDEFDPFLLRRRTNGDWDGKQQWEIKTSSGKIPEGWEPYAYDTNDEFDPFLLRRRIK